MVVLYTHTDFDGLACAVLVCSVEEVTDIRFVEPEDIQKRLIEVSRGCIITDLPYHSNAGKWLDHHASGTPPEEFEGRFDPHAKSAARVVLDYYDNPFLYKKFSELVDATDKIDSASFTIEDVKNPSGYYLLSFALDADKTAAQAREFRRTLIELLRKKTLEQVLALPEINERIEKVLSAREKSAEEVEDYTREDGGVCIVDLRGAPDWVLGGGTKFSTYLKHPTCFASIRVREGKREGTSDFSLGQNIFSVGCRVDLGAVAREHGGGGHRAAAGFTVDSTLADAVLEQITRELNSKQEAEK